MGIALGTEERRGIRHYLEVEVREIGVPAVTHQADHLASLTVSSGFTRTDPLTMWA